MSRVTPPLRENTETGLTRDSNGKRVEEMVDKRYTRSSIESMVVGTVTGLELEGGDNGDSWGPSRDSISVL